MGSMLLSSRQRAERGTRYQPCTSLLQNVILQTLYSLNRPCNVIHIGEKDQHDAHFFLIIYFTYITLDVFRTDNFSSSGGGLYKQLTVFAVQYDAETVFYATEPEKKIPPSE